MTYYPYTIVAGNLSREIRKRIDRGLTDILLEFKWWDKSVDEINKLIPILTSSNLEYVKEEKGVDYDYFNNRNDTYRQNLPCTKDAKKV